MKHFCIFCWSKWACGIAKGKLGCSGHYLTMCDFCLDKMTMRHIRYIQPLMRHLK